MKVEKSKEAQLRHRLDLLELCFKTKQEQRNQINKELWQSSNEVNETLQKLEREYGAKRKEIRKPLEDIEKNQGELDREIDQIRSECQEIRKQLRHIDRSKRYNFLPGKRLATPVPMISG